MSNSDAIVIQLTREQALVLYDWLWRADESGRLPIGHEAEQSVLWTLEGELERLLVEPLHKDYVGLVEAARAHIAGTDASSEGER